MAIFTSVGNGLELFVKDRNEQISIAISGTYNMVIALQIEQGSKGSGIWKVLRTYRTPNDTVSDTYTTDAFGQNLRLIVLEDTSGSATVTLTDEYDKTIHQLTDEVGNFYVTYKQSGAIFHGDVTVEGNLTADGIGGGGSGTVNTSGTPANLDFAQFTDTNTIRGRDSTEVKSDLGLVIGTNIQAWDADLDALAALTTPATKLDGIETGATADQSDAEIETAYNNQVAAASQVEAETGSEVAIRRWSPLRVAQAAAEAADVANAVSLQGSPLDAAVGSPSDGSILVYRDAGNDWILEAKPEAGSNPAIGDITDIVITSVADNEVLAYDNGSGNWINQTPAEAGLAATAHTHVIDDVTDIVLDSPADNEVLAFDTSSGDWLNQTAAEAGLATSDHVHLLDTLDDVDADSPANNDVLAYDTASGDWTNQTALEAGLQVLLANAGVTVRSSGTLSFDAGDEGYVWTVDGSGNVSFADISSHSHVLEDITDAGLLAGLNIVSADELQDEAVTLDKIVNQAGITPGAYTNANITVSQEGIVTAVSSGASSGGLDTVDDSGTSITIGDSLAGTHRRLTADTSITLTLDAQATIGTRVAVTPKGSGVVTASVESGATYELPLDNDAARVTSFVVGGYVLFECVANSDDDSAVWDVVGETNHTDTADNALNMNGQQITNAVMPLVPDEEAASFTFGTVHSQQAMVYCNHASVAITATVPANATTAFPVGCILNLNQWGAAAVTVAAAGGVTINKPADKTLVLRGQYSAASLWKQATNVWLLIGDLTDSA